MAMAFLKRKRVGKGVYLYVVESYRTPEGKVREHVLQYLGSADAVSTADADAAVAHWQKPWPRPRKGRGKR